MYICLGMYDTHGTIYHFVNIRIGRNKYAVMQGFSDFFVDVLLNEI
jgi:hypothetical protein